MAVKSNSWYKRNTCLPCGEVRTVTELRFNPSTRYLNRYKHSAVELEFSTCTLLNTDVFQLLWGWSCPHNRNTWWSATQPSSRDVPVHVGHQPWMRSSSTASHIVHGERSLHLLRTQRGVLLSDPVPLTLSLTCPAYYRNMYVNKNNSETTAASYFLLCVSAAWPRPHWNPLSWETADCCKNLLTHWFQTWVLNISCYINIMYMSMYDEQCQTKPPACIWQRIYSSMGVSNSHTAQFNLMWAKLVKPSHNDLQII